MNANKPLQIQLHTHERDGKPKKRQNSTTNHTLLLLLCSLLQIKFYLAILTVDILTRQCYRNLDLDLSLKTKPEVKIAMKNSLIPCLCSLSGCTVQCLAPDFPDFQTPDQPQSPTPPLPHPDPGHWAMWKKATDLSAGGWDSFPVLPRLSLLQWWP